MANTQERITNDLPGSGQNVDATTAAAENTVGSLEETAGAVGALVGVLTGGLAIAAAAGFVLGAAVGVAIGLRAAPSPPPWWQVWR